MHPKQVREFLRRFWRPDRKFTGPFPLGLTPTEVQDFIQIEKNILRDIKQTDDVTWQAPSTEHAVVKLQCLARLHRIYEEPTDGRPVPPYGPIFYRGQRDASWTVCPSLERFTEPERAMAAAQLLAAVVGFFHKQSEYPPFGAKVALAAAQHYGIPTQLVDFTVDPIVAAFFAVSEANAGAAAAVYWLPFDQATANGVNVVLVPPWIERVHLQRGLFLDFAGRRPSEVATLHRVIFPADPTFASEPVGRLSSPLLKGEPWFEHVVTLAQQNATGECADEAFIALVQQRVGRPSFVGRSMTGTHITEWAHQLKDVMDWLFMTQLDGRPNFYCAPLRLLLRSNYSFLLSMLAVAREAMASELIETLPADGRTFWSQLGLMARCLSSSEFQASLLEEMKP